jgi:hypothetical protein
MSAFFFGGIWTYPSLTFPDHAEFMSIDGLRGRIITFVVISVEPVKHVPIRSWYCPASATSITARLRPTEPWRVYVFQLDGDHLSWTYGGATHSWRRVLPNEQPDWLEARLANANSKMDALDQCG